MTAAPQQYQKEKAAREEKARCLQVLSSPEAKGKQDLAIVLLGTEMLPGEIITALSKAPAPQEAATALPSVQTTDPTLTAFNTPKVPRTFWDQDPLYQAGRQFALWSQGTIAKKE